MKLLRHTVFNFLGSAIPLAVSLVTIPLYLHLVGIERYGVLSVAWILLGYFGLFDLGLGRATTQRISLLAIATPAARADSVWTALGINCIIGGVGAITLGAFGYYFFGSGFNLTPSLRREALDAVPLLALSVPVATLTGVLTGALQARGKFWATNLISTVSTVAFQILPLGVAAFLGVNIWWVLFAAIVVRIIAVFYLWRLCQREFFQSAKPSFLRSEALQLLKFGGWVTVTSILAPLLVMVDRVYIGAVLGAAAVATYSIAVQLAQRLTMLPQALTGAAFPSFATANKEQGDVLSERSVEAILAILSPVVVFAIFACGPFFRLWLAANFNDIVVPVSQVLLAAFWVNSIAFVPFVRLQAVGRPDLVSISLIVEMPIYLALLWVGMTYGGLVGGAVALAARLVLDYVLLTIFSKQLPAPRATGLLGAAVVASVGLAPHNGYVDMRHAVTGLVIFCISCALVLVFTPVIQMVRGRNLWRMGGRYAEIS